MVWFDKRSVAKFNKNFDFSYNKEEAIESILWIIGLRKMEFDAASDIDIIKSSTNIFKFLLAPAKLSLLLLITFAMILFYVIGIPFVLLSAIRFGGEQE